MPSVACARPFDLAITLPVRDPIALTLAISNFSPTFAV